MFKKTALVYNLSYEAKTDYSYEKCNLGAVRSWSSFQGFKAFRWFV